MDPNAPAPERAPPERTRGNKLLLGLHFACAVVLPGAGTFAATLMADAVGWGAGLTPVVRVLLFFLVLPVYFIYMGIAVGRVFPRRTRGALLSFGPVALMASAVAASGDLRSVGVVLMRFGLPLFAGFMSLLAGGFLVLAVAKSRGEPDWGTRALVIALLLALVLLPVLFVVAMDLGLAAPHERLKAGLRLALGIGAVVAFHLEPLRQLYREGKL